MIGEAGLTANVLKEIALGLDSHGLIKVRVFGDDREARAAMYDTICEQLDASPVQHIGNLLVVLLCALVLGYLIPKRMLAYVAKKRQQEIAVEISTFIPLLRILFESGMAVEQALRVLSLEARQLLPVLTGELRVVLARVDSGLELGQELSKTASLLDVDEFNDTCVILLQLIQQGGGAMKSLQALKALLDDRRAARLEEYISKMSAKMSVVMMVFLFPALMMVLAGPSFIAISRAFGS